MNKVALCLLLFTFFGCASKKEQALQRRDLSIYFQGAGVTQYFLPELPKWGNFSRAGVCHRSQSIKYINIKKIMASFSLSYEEAVQLQLMYNAKLKERRENSKLNTISFKMEERIFFNSSDKIQSGIRHFKIPKFKRVHLIWIDEVISGKQKNKKLKMLMQQSSMQKGYPVFISLCLDYSSVKAFLHKSGLRNHSFRIISSELFSPFNTKGELQTYFSLKIDDLFTKDYKLHLYMPTKERPKEFKGKFKLHKY